jgi:peptide/nickel transport system permease protein
MRLDEPLYIQYVGWVNDILHGELGRSLRTRQDVMTDLVQRIPVTAELALLAVVLAVLVAIPLGVIAGTNKDRWPDHVSRMVSLVGVSFPRFWLAILLQVVFVGWLALFPLQGRISPNLSAPPHTTGLYLIDSAIAGQWNVFVDVLWHLLLPAVALANTTVAQVTRLVGYDMRGVSRGAFILTTRSYRLPNNVLGYKNMLPNSFSSSLTVIGIFFANMLAGAFYVELIFNLPGVGTYAVFSILQLDMNVIVGVTVFVGLVYLTINGTVDVLYGFLDPRIRHGSE